MNSKQKGKYLLQFLRLNRLLVFISLFLTLSSVAESSTQEANSKEFLKLCHSVYNLSDNYNDALIIHQIMIDSYIEKMKNEELNLKYPLNLVGIESHYGEHASDVLSYERTYQLYAVKVMGRDQIVENVKECQKEMKKIAVFSRAFAEYVNTQRYFSDSKKNEGLVMIEKITESLNSLKDKLYKLKFDTNQLRTKHESVLLKDHDLKRILEPMMSDMEDLTFLLMETEDAKQLSKSIERIKAKRLDLINAKEKREKEIGYLLKDSKKPALCENFYHRYNSVLTKMQNVLEDPKVNIKMIRAQWDVIKVSMSQLDKTYDKIKK